MEESTLEMKIVEDGLLNIVNGGVELISWDILSFSRNWRQTGFVDAWIQFQ